jgi:hypothetical protein
MRGRCNIKPVFIKTVEHLYRVHSDLLDFDAMWTFTWESTPRRNILPSSSEVKSLIHRDSRASEGVIGTSLV